jgi:hypothetical protein
MPLLYLRSVSVGQTPLLEVVPHDFPKVLGEAEVAYGFPDPISRERVERVDDIQ